MALGDLAQNISNFRDTGGITDFIFGSAANLTIPTPQSDDRGTGKPYSMIMTRGVDIIAEYTFYINPETTNYSFPSRSTVVQTLGGATIDHFAIGVPTLVLSGSTGWSVRGNRDGFKAYKELQDFYETYQFELSREATLSFDSASSAFGSFDTRRLTGALQIEYTDGPSQLTYKVHLQDLKLNRSKNRPLLFPFTLTMRVLDIDSRTNRSVIATFDTYADFFANGTSRSSLANRAAEIKDQLAGLESSKGILPTGFQAIFDVGNDALDTVDNLVSIGEDSIAMIQDTADFITNNISRVSSSIRNVARTLQDLATLPSSIATEFISTINGVIQAFGDLECVLQDFSNGRNLRPKIRLISGGNVCATILGATTPEIRPVQGQNTFEELSSAGVPVEILESVTLSTSALASLALLESIDPVLESFDGIDPISELANAIEGLIIDTTVDYEQSVNEAGLDINNIDVIDDVTSQTLIQGDSLQSLAAAHLGDSQRWEEIAVLNTLRYPYISDQFIETLGPKLADLLIVSGSGDTYVFVNVEGAAEGQEIYFNNGSVEQAHIVDSVNNSTNTIVLKTATTVTYLPTAQCSLHENPEESNTKVLKVGEFILIAVTATSATSVNSKELEDDSDFNRIFGLDIELDNNGFLTLDENIGDIVITETGRDNMKQALNIRINTSPEELKHHSDFGIGLPSRIGRQATQENASQILVDLRSGIPRDPRIISIKNAEAVIQNDATGIRFDAVANNDLTLTNFNFVATR